MTCHVFFFASNRHCSCIAKIHEHVKLGDGQGRYLMRRYLEQKLGKPIFQSYRKPEGLDIIPSTLDLFQKNYARGAYDVYIGHVSAQSTENATKRFLTMRDHIHELMLKFLR